MSALCDYAENKIVDGLLRNQPVTFPTTYYMALSTDVRSDDGAPVEPSDTAYARVSVPAALTSFSGSQAVDSDTVSSGTSGTVANLIEIAWPTSTDAWGNVQSVWFMDAATAGNAWISFNLNTPVNVNMADFTVRFPVGQLTFQIDN